MSEVAENRQRPFEDVHPEVKGWSLFRGLLLR